VISEFGDLAMWRFGENLEILRFDDLQIWRFQIWRSPNRLSRSRDLQILGRYNRAKLISEFGDLAMWRFGENLEILRFDDLQIWRFPDLEIAKSSPKSPDLEISRFCEDIIAPSDLRIWRSGDVEIWRKFGDFEI
jgi:hypothetical protein